MPHVQLSAQTAISAARILSALAQERENDANSHYLLEGWHGYRDAARAWNAAAEIFDVLAQEWKPPASGKMPDMAEHYRDQARKARHRAGQAREEMAEAARELADADETAWIEARDEEQTTADQVYWNN